MEGTESEIQTGKAIKSALILFVSAWLISPAGLPLAAQKLLEVLYAGCERMQDWVMG